MEHETAVGVGFAARGRRRTVGGHHGSQQRSRQEFIFAGGAAAFGTGTNRASTTHAERHLAEVGSAVAMLVRAMECDSSTSSCPP